MRKIDYSVFTQPHFICLSIQMHNRQRRSYRRNHSQKPQIPKPIRQPIIGLEPYRVSQSELVPGQRYTFCRNPEITDGDKLVLRARFLQLYNYEHIQFGYSTTTYISKSIMVDSVNYETDQRTRLTWPFDWIHQIINLETILQNKCPLPDEVLRIIDSYV